VINKEHISDIQVAMLLSLTILPSSFLLVPSIMTQIAGNSAWAAVLLIPPLFGYAVLRVVLRLGNLFPGLTLAQYSERLLGKGLGKALTLFFFSALLMMNITFLRECSGLLTLTYYPHTPAWFIHLVIMIVAIYAVDKGIEVIARMGQFLFPIFVGGAILGPNLLIPEIQPSFLLPLFEDGILPLLQASVVPNYIFGEMILLAFLLPFINKPHELKRQGLYSIGGIALITALHTAFAIMVLGPELTASVDIPSYELSRYIEYRYYLQRIDTILTAIWTLTAMLRACVLHYVICLTGQQLLGLKTNRALNIPLAVVQSFAAWYLFANEEYLLHFMKESAPVPAFAFQLGIPLFLLGIAFIKTKLKPSPNLNAQQEE